MASGFLGELGGITAGVGAEGLAFAAGFAASHALEPEAVTIRQDAWNAARVLRIPPEVAAAIAAENISSYDDMANEAHYYGWDDTRFPYLYHLNLVAPGTGELLTMLRHGTINSGNFTHGLRKNKLEPMWDDAIAELQTQRLTPAELALGIVRSTVADPGLLVTTLDTSGSTIPKYPVWPGSALTEAAAWGVDEDRLRVMVGAVGLPMSLQQAASAAFRGIINRQAFNLAVLEGDTRPEYADAIFEQARQILTSEQYAELQLRGYLSRAERLAGTEQHGMSDANSDLLYDVLGRGLSLKQAFIGERRGGVFQGDTSQIPDWAMFQLQRGNLRPEVYNLAWAGRETLPSAFVIRSLLTDGAIPEAQGESLFLESGWPADLAKTVAQHYSAGKGSSSDPHVSKAQTQLWTTTHRSYVGGETTDADATKALEAAGVGVAAIPAVLTLWQEEQSLVRKKLTAAQVKKAWSEAVVNPATGAAWTKDEATAYLIESGYSANDAATFLEL